MITKKKLIHWLFIIAIITLPLIEFTENTAYARFDQRLLNQAWDSFKNNKYENSLNFLESISVEHPDVFYLKGHNHYSLNHFDKAERNFRKALSSYDNRDVLQQLNDLIDRSSNLSKLRLSQHYYAHFEILASQDIPMDVPGQINNTLRKAYQNIGWDLDRYPDFKFTVIVLPSSRYHEIIKAPSWSSGVFDGKIYIKYQSSRSNPYSPRTLYHEYTHALVHLLARQNVPLWFNEGFATRKEHEQSNDDFRYQLLPNNLPKSNITSLEEINSLFKSEDQKQVRLAYEYSYSLVEFINEKYGNLQLRELLEQTGKLGSFKKALDEVLFTTPDSLRLKWESWVEGEFK